MVHLAQVQNQSCANRLIYRPSLSSLVNSDNELPTLFREVFGVGGRHVMVGVVSRLPWAWFLVV